MPHKTQYDRKSFCQDLSDGMSLVDLGNKYHVSTSTIVRWKNEVGNPKPKQPRKRINKISQKSPTFKAGDKYYHLTFTGQYKFLKNRWMAEFQCDCGDMCYIQTYNVWSGDKRFCSRVKHKSIHPNRLKYGTKYPFILLLAGITSNKERMKKGCSLTCEDIMKQFDKQDGKCIFTNRRLVLPNHQKDKNENMVSIDRIDSSLGYHFGNIQLTIPMVNKMKFDMTNQEFVNLCQEVSSKYLSPLTL